MAAKALNTPEEAVRTGAGLLLVGRSRVKAALDLDWGEPDAKSQALSHMLEA
ncbi:MAG: hypothetical protein HY731_07690 [Candidatus Tectomicrobia bacterium]|nr:hypothetical protein [Candidatus Tectomicrobia bacterium]